MTKDEIKKALEMCAGNCFRICCPYGTAIGDCCGKLKKDALDLITDQEREIEQLKAENEELTKVMSSKVYDFVNKIIDETNTRLEIEKQAKIDVLNELKERIKTAIYTYFNLDGGGYYLAEGALDDIDELIEEVEQ